MVNQKRLDGERLRIGERRLAGHHFRQQRPVAGLASDRDADGRNRTTARMGAALADHGSMSESTARTHSRVCVDRVGKWKQRAPAAAQLELDRRGRRIGGGQTPRRVVRRMR